MSFNNSKFRRIARYLAKETCAPFQHVSFAIDNKELLMKYLSKNTINLEVENFDQYEVPEISDQYKRNPLLLGKVKNREFTQLQMLEWIKCSLNATYFTRKYIKIISLDDGLIKFDMYPYQEDMISLFQNNRYSIVGTGRQQGKTTTAAAYILWFATFHSSKQVAVLANKSDQAQEIVERIQMSYEYLPVFLKQGVTTYNKRSMTFTNHSKIFSGASTKSSIRGKSISLVYWDEAAHTDNDIEFYESVFPTISSGKDSKVIMTSTPNGARGLFYKIWTEYETNGYTRLKVTWDMITSRDEEWKREMIAATSYEQFLQEHCVVFRGSQKSLLNAATLEKLVHREPDEIKNDVKIYHDVEDNHIYATIVDVSRGLGQDFSAFIVFDVTEMPYRVVATYRNNKISPVLYPSVIFSTATHYNNAMVLVEINDIGEQVASILYNEYEYEELLMTKSDKSRQIIWYGNDCKLGVRTTTAVKSVGCSNIKTLIENEKIELNDKTVIDEFGTFVPKGKSYEADSGANDDFAMCCVLFAWATTQQYFKDMTDINTRVELLKDKENNEQLTPFGFIERDFDPTDGQGEDVTQNPFGIKQGEVDINDVFFDGF
jgi:hypothetical protein